MATKEPKIFADGLTNEEVHQWMALKVSAGRQLQGALAEKAELQQALKHLDHRISELTNAADLELIDMHLDPILHPECQENNSLHTG
ncbi:TPA: hypothetical protein OUF49_000782 [Enterobacter asburiae]|nr:hypothetical protein [Enterobacter asburiae]